VKLLFLHGWRSVPGGVKPTYLARHGYEVINPALPDEDFPEAVRIAQAEFDTHRPSVVVGSSRGGAVALTITSENAGLVLLCPAWRKYAPKARAKAATVVLHSRADDVVPFADSEELVRASGLPARALIEIGTDHRLADPEPLAAMLGACAGVAPNPAAAFAGTDIRVGTVASVVPFPEGRYSTHVLMVDFGPPLGVKKSLARLVPNYTGSDLVGRQVVCVVNLPTRQIGPHRSEVLTVGVPDAGGNVVLLRPDREVPLGGRMF
jgi:export-related chaperone CsaA